MSSGSSPIVHSTKSYPTALFLALLSLNDFGISGKLHKIALRTFDRLAHAGAPEPGIELPDGAVRFTWSFNDIYLHLDVLEDGFSWFFEDDRTHVVDGTRAASEPTIPDAFFENLSRIGAHA